MTGSASSAVVWDLDSTVANTQHRHHLSPARPENKGNPEFTWERYSLACGDDTPIAGSVALMHLLWPHHQQIAVSGRSRAAQSLTDAWAFRHDVPLDRIWLRGQGNRAPNGELKIRRVHQLRAEGVDVVLFVEDWAEVARDITKQTGVPVLTVNPDYEGICTCGAVPTFSRWKPGNENEGQRSAEETGYGPE